MRMEFNESGRKLLLLTDEDRSEKALLFLETILNVCRDYGLSLTHEDSHGSFQVRPLSGHDQRHLGNAHELVGVHPNET